ncbi:MAG TPA: SDR family oxidoreductase, partial [Nordella sp.]|nr:SDR family oxidoreductase [Nordella sp.]
MNPMDKFRLDDRTVIVTGGARGIGLAVAELCAAAGADIAIIDRLEDQGRASATRLAASSGRKVRFYSADLADWRKAEDVTAEIARVSGRLHVLMNCIGIGPNTDALKIPPQEWADVMNVNVNAQFYIAQAVAKRMAETGGGSIVAIGSNSGLIVDRPQPQAHYNASKAAVHQMVKSLAVELAPHQIRVNAVAPGFVMTDMTKDAITKSGWLDIWTHNTPMGRLANPDEVAYGMLYLAR